MTSLVDSVADLSTTLADLGISGTPTKARRELQELVNKGRRMERWVSTRQSPQTKHHTGFTKTRSWTDIPIAFRGVWADSQDATMAHSSLEAEVSRVYAFDPASRILRCIMDYVPVALDFDKKDWLGMKVLTKGVWQGRFPLIGREDLAVARAEAAVCWLHFHQQKFFNIDLDLLVRSADEQKCFHEPARLLVSSLLLFEPGTGPQLVASPEDCSRPAPREDFRVEVVEPQQKLRDVQVRQLRRGPGKKGISMKTVVELSRNEVKSYSLMAQLHDGLGELVSFSKDHNEPVHVCILTDFWTVIGMCASSHNDLDYSFVVTPRMEIGCYEDRQLPVITPAGYLYLARYIASLRRKAKLPARSLDFGGWIATGLVAETESSVVLAVEREGKLAVAKIPRKRDALFMNELRAHGSLDTSDLPMSHLEHAGSLECAGAHSIDFAILSPRGTALIPLEDANLLATEGYTILVKLHKLGFVHGDIKPDNFFKCGPVLHLNDFGTCRKVGQPRLGSTPGYCWEQGLKMAYVDDWRALYLSYLELRGIDIRTPAGYALFMTF
jgi:hypothetical protein